jgi:hypothetical protein
VTSKICTRCFLFVAVIDYVASPVPLLLTPEPGSREAHAPPLPACMSGISLSI